MAEGGFSLFNISQMEGRRALVSRGDMTGGNYQQNHKLYIRFLDPKLEDSLIEDSPESINPSLKPDNNRFVYENGGILYIHKLAGGGDIEKVAAGGMPDWGASADGPGFGDDTGLTTGTTSTTRTTGGDNGGGTGGGTGDCDQVIPPGTGWYRYDSPDLLKAIPDAASITKVTIGGSGWDFGSRIGLVSLKGS